MPLNEADTCAQLIDPQINVAGWTLSRVTREHYYRPDWEFTAGRIALRGDRAKRLPPRRVDYLRRYTDCFPIAAVEAKEECKPAVSGLEQVKIPKRWEGVISEATRTAFSQLRLYLQVKKEDGHSVTREDLQDYIKTTCDIMEKDWGKLQYWYLATEWLRWASQHQYSSLAAELLAAD
jgi:type I site-specific restriction endonuclease